jgi:hypothetical protein
LITLALVFVVLLSVYLGIVRPLLKTQPVLSAAFKAEASFADKARAKIVGWRTRIASRLTILAGSFVWLYDQALPFITGQDWTPLTAKIPAWSFPIGLAALGLLFAYLRKISDNPPQLITATDDDGVKKVVAVVTPGAT